MSYGLRGLMVLGVVVACLFQIVCTQLPRQQLASAPSQPQLTQPTSDAERQAQQYWLSRFTQCGEFHVTRDRSIITELKGFAITVTEDPISDADRLNSIEWQGSSEVTATAARMFNKTWTDWQNGTAFPVSLVIRLVKQRGKWSITSSDYSEVQNLTALKCTDAEHPEVLYQQEQAQAAEQAYQAKVQQGPSQGIYCNNIPREMYLSLYNAKYQGDFGGAIFMPSGGWLVLYANSGIAGDGIAEPLRSHIIDLNNHLARIRVASVSPSGGTILLLGVNELSLETRGIPKDLQANLDRLYAVDHYFEQIVLCSVSFAPNGGWVITYREAGNGEYLFRAISSGLPSDVDQALTTLTKQKANITSVVFGSNNSWLIKYGKNQYTSSNLPPDLRSILDQFQKMDRAIYTVALSPTGGWAVIGQGNSWY